MTFSTQKTSHTEGAATFDLAGVKWAGEDVADDEAAGGIWLALNAMEDLNAIWGFSWAIEKFQMRYYWKGRMSDPKIYIFKILWRILKCWLERGKNLEFIRKRQKSWIRSGFLFFPHLISESSANPLGSKFEIYPHSDYFLPPPLLPSLSKLPLSLTSII